ncbi:YopX family protein [Polluticaenibacter yanchengensis]|uniref:YopX family protein n=1 Tax=Polluticaenibacter yanchengensis TaxID=3014562 RepID=A0ABT4UK31_9BACT|nr:YopX family protein [Chitinophagaceae bacterium LY-5]
MAKTTKIKNMREIKFRGKTINGDWVFGNYAHIKKDFSTVKKGHYISNSAGSPFAYMVRSETLGQFTGLKDNSGKDIFEGDIIKTGTDKPMVILWSNKYASFCLDRHGWAFSHWFGESCDPTDVEIIGNIHDNPELLK